MSSKSKNSDNATDSSGAATAGEGDGTKGGLIAVLFLGLIAGLQLIDPAVANVAIVSAARDLGMQGSTLALASSISTLALAATVLPSGLLADRLGRRKVLMAALVLTAVGDVIVAISPDVAGYFIGRILAGIGVGAALAASFAYVRFVSKPGKVAVNLGLWNSSLIFIFLLGSLAGGIIANSSWRSAMLLVPILAIIACVLVPIILPAMPKVQGGKIDYLGMVTIALAMISFLYGVSQAADGFSNPKFYIPTLVGLALFVAYYFVERHVEEPVIPFEMFAKATFLAAVVAGIGWNFAQGAVQLQSSNFWQYVQNFSTGEVASTQLIFMVSYGIFGVIVGKSIQPGKRMSYLLGGGFAILALGFFLMFFVTAESGIWFFGPILFLFGIGLALVSVPQSVMFVQAAPAKFFGPVTSFRTTAGQLGYALGFAVSASLLSTFGRLDLKSSLEADGVPQSQMEAVSQQVMDWLFNKTEPTLAAAKQATAQAGANYTEGFKMMMIICGVLLVILGIITLLLLAKGRRQDALEEANVGSDGSAT